MLERLFYEHVRRVRDYVGHHYPSADVDDVVSETFIVAGRRLDDAVSGKEFSWLLGIARNIIRNTTRASRRRAEFHDALIATRPELTVGLGSDQLLSEDIEPVAAAFGRLHEHDQEIMLLAIWEELSAAELGEVLGISTRRASDRLHRARKRLRKELGHPGEEE